VLHKNGNLLVKGRRWRGPKQVGTAPGQKELYAPEPTNPDHLPIPKP
jgi:hypothetical protein